MHTALGGDDVTVHRLRMGWSVTFPSLAALYDRVTQDGVVNEKDEPVLKDWMERMHGLWNATLVFDALYLAAILPMLLDVQEPADGMDEATAEALTFYYESAVSVTFLLTVAHTTLLASLYCFSCFLTRPTDILAFMVGTARRQVFCNVLLFFQLILFLISGISGFLLTHGLGGVARFNLYGGVLVLAFIIVNFLLLQCDVKRLLKAE